MTQVGWLQLAWLLNISELDPSHLRSPCAIQRLDRKFEFAHTLWSQLAAGNKVCLCADFLKNPSPLHVTRSPVGSKVTPALRFRRASSLQGNLNRATQLSVQQYNRRC